MCAAPLDRALEKVTRTGKAVLSPDSSLYLINPCPPARVLPKHHDFVDEHGNKYYNAFMTDALLA
jgi:hypothetical protein